jgi:stress-induced morphogen
VAPEPPPRSSALELVPSSEDIRQRIEAAIPGSQAEVEDYTGGGDHFRATVTAAAFAGRSRIEQHRLVYDVFGAEIGAAIHALSLKTCVPQQGVARQESVARQPSAEPTATQ